MQRNFAPVMGSGEALLLVRLGGKLVLEILPAALASAIGAFLFAQYQFDRGAADAHAVAPAVAVPASPEMLQLVREEHAMIRDFLTAQRTAEQNRAAAANVADAQASTTAGAELAAAVPVEADPTSVGKAAARRKRTIGGSGATITIAAARPTAATAHVMVASADSETTALGGTQAAAQPGAGLWPPAPPPPTHASLVAETLAVPGHVVSVTLHAVMAIGGIPSWLGHRFGDDDTGSGALPYSSAS